MARQNKDDMTVVTFVRKDMINLPHDLRTTLDVLNHPKGQWRNQTRNDCEKNRSFRTTAVCLGFLCALLSLAITVLCVKFAKEYDQGYDNSKWISYNRHSYFLSSEWKNWTDSREDCRKKGADLIIINNREEQEFIRKLTSLNIAWIGLSDIDAEGVWKWVDGNRMTLMFWYPKEPNSKTGEEDCVVSSYDWADYPCNYTFVWICERD